MIAPRVTLYGMKLSAGSRLCEWAARCAGVPFTIRVVDLFSDEHKTTQYRALTEDRHCIPAMTHGARRMTESRAIAGYLLSGADGIGAVDKRGKFAHGAELTPWLSAKVDELVQYDATCLYKRVSAHAYPILFGIGEAPDIPDPNLHKSLRLLEDRLGGHPDTPADDYLLGAKPTLADLVLANTLSLLCAVPGTALGLEGQYPLVSAWLGRMMRYGEYPEVVRPFEEFAHEKLAAWQAEPVGAKI